MTTDLSGRVPAVLKAYLAGETQTAIAIRFKVPLGFVHAWIRGAGIHRPKPMSARKLRILKMVSSGLSYRDTAREEGCTSSYVGVVVQEARRHGK